VLDTSLFFFYTVTVVKLYIMTVTNEDGGRQNMFAKEPQMYITEEPKMFGFTPEAEILNARLAMLGFVIAIGTYATTGQIIPGIW
jgi:hypothetical protein